MKGSGFRGKGPGDARLSGAIGEAVELLTRRIAAVKAHKDKGVFGEITDTKGAGEMYSPQSHHLWIPLSYPTLCHLVLNENVRPERGCIRNATTSLPICVLISGLGSLDEIGILKYGVAHFAFAFNSGGYTCDTFKATRCKCG